MKCRNSIAQFFVFICLANWLTDVIAEAQVASSSSEEEAAYVQAITERAQKIVDTLGIAETDEAVRVRDIIAQQYRSLRDIHDTRDSRIEELNKEPAVDPTVAAAWIKVARDQANLQLVEQHRRFNAQLLTELTPELVEKVKDGMTYGVAQITYRRYSELLPQLKDEEKRVILAHLLEAREYAMDAGSSEEKHAIFGKYKGRINNILSAAGYDLKQAEKDLAARENTESRPR